MQSQGAFPISIADRPVSCACGDSPTVCKAQPRCLAVGAGGQSGWDLLDRDHKALLSQ